MPSGHRYRPNRLVPRQTPLKRVAILFIAQPTATSLPMVAHQGSHLWTQLPNAFTTKPGTTCALLRVIFRTSARMLLLPASLTHPQRQGSTRKNHSPAILPVTETGRLRRSGLGRMRAPSAKRGGSIIDPIRQNTSPSRRTQPSPRASGRSVPDLPAQREVYSTPHHEKHLRRAEVACLVRENADLPPLETRITLENVGCVYNCSNSGIGFDQRGVGGGSLREGTQDGRLLCMASSSANSTTPRRWTATFRATCCLRKRVCQQPGMPPCSNQPEQGAATTRGTSTAVSFVTSNICTPRCHHAPFHPPPRPPPIP